MYPHAVLLYAVDFWHATTSCHSIQVNWNADWN